MQHATSLIQSLLACLTANIFRSTLVSLSVIYLLQAAIVKFIKRSKFRQQVDKLPGPPYCNQLLGNIPSEVFSLVCSSFNSSTASAEQPNSKSADQFYLSQIQSLLGHTLIYRKEPLFRLWLGQEPVICVWKAEQVDQVLSDNFLLEKSYHYDFLRPWLGDGLLTSPGRIWRPRRKLLVPSFHFNILRAFVPVFDRKSKLMVRNIKRRLAKEIFTNDAAQARATSDKRRDSRSKLAASSGTVVDITPIITACTLDAICETIMGVSIDAQECPENDYCESIYLVGETFLERIIQPRYWLDTIFRFTELGKLYNYHLSKLHSFTRRVIAEKKAVYGLTGTTSDQQKRATQLPETAPPPTGPSLVSKVKVLKQGSVDSYESAEANFAKRTKSADQDGDKSVHEQTKLPKAFLDLLLDKVMIAANYQQQHQQSSLRIMSDEDIREEVDTFMFEGHDTTAMALSWTLFLLGHNAQVQARLQSEVDQFYAEVGNKLNQCETGATNIDDCLKLDLDHLKQLKYLDCVIKEALRLCPSVPFIGRKTMSELKLAGHIVPPGCVIFVLIYQLHRNPEIFPNPEKFDPDRFLPENTLGRHPFAYVPFSAGPRNCIGQKFAMAEMKTIILHLIRNFNFESVTPLEKAQVRMEMVLRPKDPLNIRVTLRKHRSQATGV